VSDVKLNKNDAAVVAALKPIGKEMMLQELADATGLPAKKVFKTLKKLFECEMIDSCGRKYRLLTDKVPVKGKDDEAEVPE
jgi:DNA-binding IclR family transcriptional regulator